jgi:hypothetical protein
MAILFDNPHGFKILGSFQEKEVGNYFTYAENPNNVFGHFSFGFPHIIFVDDFSGHGYRYADVLKTVARVCVDEDEWGQPVVEKWNIKQNTFRV